MSPQDLIAQAERQADLYRRAQEKEETERREREEKIASLTSSMIHMQFHENLLADKEMLEEVYRMGLLEETVDQFRIGINPAFTFMEDEKLVTVKALTIPVISWDGMRVMNIRHRILDPLYTKKNKYRPIYKGLGNYFLHATRDTSTCFIVEGEKKAMVLWWFGFSAIGLFGIDDHKPEWYELWHQKYSRLVVCFDNDSKAVISSGKLFARELGASWVDLGGKPDDLLLGQDESLAQAALAKLYGMEQREETQIGNMERITTI